MKTRNNKNIKAIAISKFIVEIEIKKQKYVLGGYSVATLNSFETSGSMIAFLVDRNKLMTDLEDGI